MPTPINLVFSYARADNKLREKLEQQLSILKRQGYISTWHAACILPGEPIAKEIVRHMQEAHIILLLVSPAFLASDYCYGHEMKMALRRHEAEEVHIIPVLFRPTFGWQNTPFGQLQMLPSDGKSVTSWRNRDEAFFNVANGIRKVCEEATRKIQGYWPTHRTLIEVVAPYPHSIQSRAQTVQDIYAKLAQPDTTILALTGIAGAGKSTLARLVYHFAEAQRYASAGSFTGKALWLKIDPAVTMIDVAGTLLEALAIPSPYFKSLSPQELATYLYNALNLVDKPHLVVLDQFEHLLAYKETKEYHSGVEEWLQVLSKQSCRCRILLTSRVWPAHIQDNLGSYMREYPTRGLEMAEGIALLQSWHIRETSDALETIVRRWNGHPLALTLLASLLSNQKLSLEGFLNDHMNGQPGKDFFHFVDYIYMHKLDQVQRTLLQAFSVFREPVPLQAAQAILDESAKVSTVQLRTALEGLLMLRLLEVNNG